MESLHSSELDGDGTAAAKFDPLVRERGYRRRDILRLFANAAGAVDLEREVVTLRPLPEAHLERLKASLPTAETSFAKDGPLRSSAKLQRTDFFSTPLRVENVVVATSLALWGTVDFTNHIIETARSRFLHGVEKTRREKKTKLPIRHFFRFLNEMHVDVVVLSADREFVTVSCAGPTRRLHAKSVATGAEQPAGRCRTLLALEFSPCDGFWSLLGLPLLIRKQRAHVDVHNVPGAGTLMRSPKFLGANKLEMSVTDLCHSNNLETMMFDQTVYNPQKMSALMDKDVETVDTRVSGDSALPRLNFSGMRYPNINQLDFQVLEVLRRGQHPILRRNCVRFCVAFPVAVAAFVVGLSLIIYVSVTLETCCYQISRGACVSKAEGQFEGNCAAFFCNATNNPAFRGAATAFLFGHWTSPGHFVVAATCCMFTASLLAAAVSYFTTRAIVQEKSRSLFYVIMMVAHVMISAAACGFSAYSFSVLSRTAHRVPCSLFSGGIAASCKTAHELCADFALEVSSNHTTHVNFALSITFLFLCVVEFLASLVPPMPDKNTLNLVQGAKPETYVYYPSVYAPDGISDLEKQKLRRRIARLLRMQLEEQMHQHEILLTRNATIGEIVIAKRQQSLMVARSREGRDVTARRDDSDEPHSPLSGVMWSDDGDGESRSSSRTVLGQEGEEEQGREGRVLPPRLVAEVERISSRVQASMQIKNEFR